MAFTIQQLFELGAHHTIEGEIAKGRLSFRDSSAALSRRFGPEIGQSAGAVAELFERVSAAVAAAGELELGRPIRPSDFPINPSLPTQYRYTVIVEIPDPIEQGKTLSVPYSIDSPDPLTGQDLIDRATRDINAGVLPPEYDSEQRNADLARRAGQLRTEIKETYKGDAPLTISILGVYRRA